MPEKPLPAHTLAEAHLYLLATPCATCGRGPLRGVGTVAETTAEPDGPPVLRIRAKCDTCGAESAPFFRVEQGGRDGDDTADPVLNATKEPSRLLDIGQWITLSKMILEAADRETDNVQARRLSIEAGLCLEEALKFYDEPDNDLPPPEAMFTGPSRERFKVNPQHFSRRRLVGLRARLPTGKRPPN
ncbi:MAG: hypothetical protein PVI86_18440 [Phycisphaerae bacterium]|jgi:hypothetical protein